MFSLKKILNCFPQVTEPLRAVRLSRGVTSQPQLPPVLAFCFQICDLHFQAVSVADAVYKTKNMFLLYRISYLKANGNPNNTAYFT